MHKNLLDLINNGKKGDIESLEKISHCFSPIISMVISKLPIQKGKIPDYLNDSTDNIDLIYSNTYIIFGTCYSYQYLVFLGFESIVKAVEDYDFNSGIPFESLVLQYIISNFNSFIKENSLKHIKEDSPDYLQ
ncbi:MAG: hypothetical protein ABRQ27_01205 [Clostridiaceae bacterium]